METDKTILDDDVGQAPKAPGMKYKHYAPKGELTIISGSRENVIEAINQKSREMEEKGKKVGVIGTDDTIAFYRADVVKSAGSREKEDTIASALYRILREFDDEGVDVIYSESFEESAKAGGIGQAIMNRLLKAAGHHMERV